VARGAVEVAARRGTPLRRVSPRALAEVVRDEDFLVTVCDHAHEELVQTSRTRPTRTLHWSVPDPVPAGTRAAFNSAYDELATRVAHLVPSLATR